VAQGNEPPFAVDEGRSSQDSGWGMGIGMGRERQDRLALERWFLPGEDEAIQHTIFHAVSLLVGLVAVFISFPANLSQGGSWPVLARILVVGLVAFGCHWEARRGHDHPAALFVGILALLDGTWFDKAGSGGPALMLFLVVGMFAFLCFTGRTRTLMLGVFFGNLAALILLERGHPQWIQPWPNPSVQAFAFTVSFLITALVCGLMLRIVMAGHAEERRKMEASQASLQDQKEQYYALFEAMHSGFILMEVILDGEGHPVGHRLLDANAEFEAQTGLKREEQIGLTMAELGFRWPEEVRRRYYEVALTGRSFAMERYNESLGKYYDIRAFSPRKGQWAMLFHDITERKRDQEALEASRRHFQEAVEYQPVPIAIAREERLVHLNLAFTKTFGYDLEEIPTIGAWMERAYPEPGYRQEVVEQWDRSLAPASGRNENTQDREYLVTCKDQSKKHVIIRRRLIGDQFLATFVDLTQVRSAEENRLKLETEVHHLQRMESVGRLAGGISHDMNNVLAAIMSMAEAMRLTEEGNPKGLDLILDATRRGRNLLKGLMTFARKEMAETESLDLNDLVRKEAELLSSTLLQRIRLQLALDPGQPRVLGSSSALATALMNLSVNAMDAMPDGGVLTLGTRILEEGRVELTVQDTGHGMSPEVVSRAMEPFYTTKPPGKGTGLGLAMVFGTVQAHGGTLEIRSQVGKGTELRITLPILRGEGPMPAMGGVPPGSGTAESLRILIVDDDAMVREASLKLFQAQGHRVTLAGGGYEALGLLDHGAGWDVVVLDLNMPDLNGQETLKRIRARKPSIPVVVATGYVEDAVRLRLEAARQVALVGKPYSLEDFHMALARCV